MPPPSPKECSQPQLLPGSRCPGAPTSLKVQWNKNAAVEVRSAFLKGIVSPPPLLKLVGSQFKYQTWQRWSSFFTVLASGTLEKQRSFSDEMGPERLPGHPMTRPCTWPCQSPGDLMATEEIMAVKQAECFLPAHFFARHARPCSAPRRAEDPTGLGQGKWEAPP